MDTEENTGGSNSFNDMIRANLRAYQRQYYPFYRTFGIKLSHFWEGSLLGFDVIRFDDELIKSPEGKSTADVVKSEYGTAGLVIIYDLLDYHEDAQEDQ